MKRSIPTHGEEEETEIHAAKRRRGAPAPPLTLLDLVPDCRALIRAAFSSWRTRGHLKLTCGDLYAEDTKFPIGLCGYERYLLDDFDRPWNSAGKVIHPDWQPSANGLIEQGAMADVWTRGFIRDRGIWCYILVVLEPKTLYLPAIEGMLVERVLSSYLRLDSRPNGWWLVYWPTTAEDPRIEEPYTPQAMARYRAQFRLPDTWPLPG
jgi:hypothetical protein